MKLILDIVIGIVLAGVIMTLLPFVAIFIYALIGYIIELFTRSKK